MTVQNDTNTIPRFLVMTSSAKMPSSVKARYRNVAVVETDGTKYPAMISGHARGLVRIVSYRGRLNVGKCVRSAYALALAEADALAEELNARDATLRQRLAEVQQVRDASGVTGALEATARVLADALAHVWEEA
jgi:hypothetical protein